MFKNSKSFSFLSCLLVIYAWSFQSHADEKSIYKKTNDQGVVEFTDVPGKNAKPVRVPPMNTYKQKKLPRIIDKPLPAELKAAYTKFSITSPLHDKIMRDNLGNINVKLQISPSLKSEHRILVTIDGDSKTAIKSTSTSVTFNNIDRGTHTVQASIVDSEDQVIMESGTITFHLQRYFVPRASGAADPLASDEPAPPASLDTDEPPPATLDTDEPPSPK